MEEVWVTKDPARTHLSGGIFEQQLAGLLNARLRSVCRRRPNLLLRFLLATNMDGANPFDDIVLNLTWNNSGRERTVTYFLQLKHAEKVDKPVNVHDLTAEKISKKNKDFNLRKYFKFYKQLAEIASSPSEELRGNKRLLHEWAQTDCRFVLFTTREVLSKAKEVRATSPLDFPLEEIFSTDQGQAFSFGETDEDVWNMLAGSSDEEVFRTEFLPRLRVFSAQAQVTVFKPLLAQGLQDLLDGPPPRAEQLFSNYTSFLHCWWESNDGYCLSEKTTEIEEMIRADVHARLQQLSFKDEYCDRLLKRLQEHRVTFIVIPGIPQELRCSMVRTVLDKTQPERFLLLTDIALKEYSHEALYALSDKLCDEVVLCTDELNEILLSFVDRVISKRINVRVLTSEWDYEIYSLMASRYKDTTSWTELWALDHLESEEQHKILKRRIYFQGHEMALEELQDTWPILSRGIRGAALGTLATGQILHLGQPLQTVERQYIPRKVIHPVTLRHSIFQMVSPQDHFLLSGFPEATLRELRDPDSPWEECSLSVVPIKRGNETRDSRNGYKTKWTCLSAETSSDNEGLPSKSTRGKNALKLGGNKLKGRRTVERKEEIMLDRHWISYENNEIVWMKSEGNTENLKEHVEQKSSSCKYQPICYHSDNRDFLTWGGSTFILTDSAGMGKSTFITYLANVIKNTNSSQWVVVVRINEGQLMDKMSDNVELHHVLRILGQYAGIGSDVAESAHMFLRNCVEQFGNITVLVDGVDEICPAHKIKALRVLEILQQAFEKSGGRLWVASRTVLKDDLAHILHDAISFSLLPFSNTDQERYLLNDWSNSVKDRRQDILKLEVEKLVASVREATNSGGRSLCDVPLYTRMLADAYTGEDIDLLLKQKEVELASLLHRGALYKRFVEKTLGVVWSKAGISESALVNLNISSRDVLQRHGLYAALECFRESSFLGEYYEDVLQAVNKLGNDLEKEKTARTGIITHLVDGRPKFLHYTLAEYLAALWLQDKYTSLPKLTRALYEGLFGEVRYFFDVLLSEDRPLHIAAMSGNTYALLSALCNENLHVEEEDNGGRRPLHLAAINGQAVTVRILLDKKAKPSASDRVLGWTALRYVNNMLRIPAENDRRSVKEQSLPFLEIIDELLMASANPKHAPRLFSERNALATAISGDYPHITKAIIRNIGWVCIQKRQKKDYMHMAAEHGSLHVLSMLLRLGFRVNVTCPKYQDSTPLHVSARKGNEEFCRTLIRHGAQVNSQDREGYTALHEAARHDNRSVCMMLLDHGADANARNNEGETPLHQAAREGHVYVCRYLVASGCDVAARDNHEFTAEDEAARWGRSLVVQALAALDPRPSTLDEPHRIHRRQQTPHIPGRL